MIEFQFMTVRDLNFKDHHKMAALLNEEQFHCMCFNVVDRHDSDAATSLSHN